MPARPQFISYEIIPDHLGASLPALAPRYLDIGSTHAIKDRLRWNNQTVDRFAPSCTPDKHTLAIMQRQC
jgi:hypothetical protein